MVAKWSETSRVTEPAGHFQIVVSAPGRAPVDISYFRDVPAELVSFSSGDPFGDAHAVIRLPQITVLDGFGAGDLEWLRDYADVDIYWVASPDGSSIDQKVWEGLIASIEINGDGEHNDVTLTCVGALYQLDFYEASVNYLAVADRNEKLIGNQFSRTYRPHLRTRELEVVYPGGWTITKNSTLWTGHETRNTGSWNRVLTGYIQDLLAIMQTSTGKQWTLSKNTGRAPVLHLRDTTTVSWTIYAGAPGVDLELTRDLTQTVNVIYGEGQDVAGTTWRNSRISNDGSRTDYDPVAYDPRVHPLVDNPYLDLSIARVEAFFKFDVMSQTDAMESGAQILQRDKDTGLFGSITLKIDPEEGSRFLIKAGQNIKVKYLNGSGIDGVVLHIASVEINVSDGTVSLTVDTKSRDLLTLNEIIMRNRDGKTPSRLLQVNRESQQIKNTKSPWDYSAGSGYVPRGALGLWSVIPTTATFPYETYTLLYPPSRYPSYYVRCKANSTTRAQRWATATIIASEADTIRLFEIAAYDGDGNQIAVPFHASFYKYDPTHGDAYPKDSSGPSPFLTDAFKENATSILLRPDPSMIIGWGDGDQKAGYWPGLGSEGDPATGMLRDEGNWTFSQETNAITRNAIYIALYCEYTEPVFFTGRLYKGVEA